MSTHKRARGRPRGSGKNDAPHLALVADLIVCEPSLRPTTAMKRVMRSRKDWGASDETLLRRWQVKWKAGAAGFLAAARDRASPKLQPTLRQVLQGMHLSEFERIAESVAALQHQPDLLRFAEEMREWQVQLTQSPALRRFAEQMREWQLQITQSPVLQRLAEQMKEWDRQTKETLDLRGVQRFVEQMAELQRTVQHFVDHHNYLSELFRPGLRVL